MNNPIIPAIPHDVADAIESMRDSYGNGGSDKLIVSMALHNAYAETPRLAAVRSIPFDTLLAALVNGYERELTAEQRAHETIRTVYVDKRGYPPTEYPMAPRQYAGPFADGIKFALDTLGVRIAEVNA